MYRTKIQKLGRPMDSGSRMRAKCLVRHGQRIGLKQWGKMLRKGLYLNQPS